VHVRGISDVLRARHGITVLVLLDEHRQPTESELLMPCTPDAGLPIDVHVGAHHPNELTSGSVIAHFAALAFLSAILLRKGSPQPFRAWSARCLAFRDLPVDAQRSSVIVELSCKVDCPSLSFDLACRGMDGGL
jgi:hypothetical protein